MAYCQEMKEGEIYYCSECGIELAVVKENKDCYDGKKGKCVEPCVLKCCDTPLKLRK